MYQILKTVFYHTSKHLKVRQKCTDALCIFNFNNLVKRNLKFVFDGQVEYYNIISLKPLM